MYDLTGKIALVTGASRGIGLHVARALAAAGAQVAVTGRSRARLEPAAATIAGTCLPLVCDQSDPSAIEALAEAVQERWGAPDILVNNAGGGGGGPVPRMALQEWQRVIATNLTGVFYTTRCFLPGMLRKERGDIFIISSMSGKKGSPGAAAYAASKFGLQGFAQSLLYDVRRSNIRVMVINPSRTDTGEDTSPPHGPGVHLHAADIAATIVHLARLPGRTLVRDLDVWGTNPFRP